jgi:hypothetical protein
MCRTPVAELDGAQFTGIGSDAPLVGDDGEEDPAPWTGGATVAIPRVRSHQELRSVSAAAGIAPSQTTCRDTPGTGPLLIMHASTLPTSTQNLLATAAPGPGSIESRCARLSA